MKKAFLLLAVLIIYSCDIFEESGIDFTIYNESNNSITQVELTTIEQLDKKSVDYIESNKSYSDVLSMKDNKTDGNYILNFKRAHMKKESIVFGYYSNGAPMNDLVTVIIKKDTVITTFSNSTGY